MLTVITVKIGRIELKSVSGLGSNLLSGAGNSAPPPHTHTHHAHYGYTYPCLRPIIAD